MARNDMIEYLILHLQQIFTISILLTFAIVFGNYASVSTATIPITYRETLLGISVVSLISIIISTYFHLKGLRNRETDKQTKPNNLMELFHGNETEDTLKIVQHGSTIIFILVVIIVLGVYLKQGNMTKEINYGFLVFSIILLLFSIYVYFISVENSHKRTRDSTYNIAAQELDSKLSVSK